jgi:NAD(P)-dependent dehydrogenase (short-subunit alcohol dehydrogenase family)
MKTMSRDSNCSIVSVASMIALFHVGDTYGYGTSKAACACFSTSVSKDVHPFGIRVNSVSPGKSRTDMKSNNKFLLAHTPTGNFETPMMNNVLPLASPEECRQLIRAVGGGTYAFTLYR